jgi:hypothetical protein
MLTRNLILGAACLFLLLSGLTCIFLIGPFFSPAVALGVYILVAAAISFGLLVTPSVSALFSSVFENLFYPRERLTAPPEDLLAKLSTRVRDHQYPAVLQQVTALEDAYGPHPGLFHLRAMVAAGLSQSVAAISIDAAQALRPADYDTYADLLARYPAQPTAADTPPPLPRFPPR